MATPVEKSYDLVISGAGIAGASLALGASQRGLRVALVDPRPALVDSSDTRTTAFLPESLAFFDRLGLMQELRSQAQPLSAMRLLNDQGSLRQKPKTLDFTGAKAAPLALNIPNLAVLRAIDQAFNHLSTPPDFYWGERVEKARTAQGEAQVTISSGQSLIAKLGIGADGPQSQIRRQLNIGWWQFSTHQTALTARLSHSVPHAGISSEFHRKDGPMTFVPIKGSGKESALVWCLQTSLADQIKELKSLNFLSRVQIASRGILGEITAVQARSSFPVRPGLAKALSQGSFVLIAEAAHTLPPLLAQGLNLSLTDVNVLLGLIETKGLGQQTARAFAQRRRADMIARLGISEGLNQFLKQAPDSLHPLYNLVYQGFAQLPGARDIAVRIGQRGLQNLPRL